MLYSGQQSHEPGFAIQTDENISLDAEGFRSLQFDFSSNSDLLEVQLESGKEHAVVVYLAHDHVSHLLAQPNVALLALPHARADMPQPPLHVTFFELHLLVIGYTFGYPLPRKTQCKKVQKKRSQQKIVYELNFEQSQQQRGGGHACACLFAIVPGPYSCIDASTPTIMHTLDTLPLVSRCYLSCICLSMSLCIALLATVLHLARLRLFLMRFRCSQVAYPLY